MKKVIILLCVFYVFNKFMNYKMDEVVNSETSSRVPSKIHHVVEIKSSLNDRKLTKNDLVKKYKTSQFLAAYINKKASILFT